MLITLEHEIMILVNGGIQAKIQIGLLDLNPGGGTSGSEEPEIIPISEHMIMWKIKRLCAGIFV